MQNNLDFQLNRTRKSGKNEFFEVHIKRAVITHLITVLFATFGVCRKVLTGFIQIKVHGRAILKRPFKRADPACFKIKAGALYLPKLFKQTDGVKKL